MMEYTVYDYTLRTSKHSSLYIVSKMR